MTTGTKIKPDAPKTADEFADHLVEHGWAIAKRSTYHYTGSDCGFDHVIDADRNGVRVRAIWRIGSNYAGDKTTGRWSFRGADFNCSYRDMSREPRWGYMSAAEARRCAATDSAELRSFLDQLIEEHIEKNAQSTAERFKDVVTPGVLHNAYTDARTRALKLAMQADLLTDTEAAALLRDAAQAHHELADSMLAATRSLESVERD